ncbi:MAG: Peptidase superfamily [Chthonomonadaceae bacterium]|nr:Peptidase superfamily [Chthonomonadaceae bacterium]
MIRWEVLLNPTAYAGSIAAHPPLGAATLFLLILGAVFGALCSWDELVIQRRWDRDLMARFWTSVTGLPLLVLSLWILFTFLSFGIERWLGHTLSFEALFCLLTIATIPRFVSWMTYLFRERSWAALYVWRVFSSVLLLSATLRLWGTVGAAGHFNGWHSLLIVVPSLAGLWATSLWEIFEKPHTPLAAYPWRRAAGKRVVVFYPQGNAPTEAEEVVREADLLVAQIEGLLDVKPLPFRIGIFLCRNREDLRQQNNVKEHLSDGYAGADHISLIYGSWEEIKCIIPHELTHVVAKQRLNMHLMPLLNEGLAEYGMAQTVAGSTRADIRVPLSLGTLAHSHVFYEWLYVAEPTYPADAKYAHAAALSDYLINRYGMDQFKELCRKTAYDAKQDPAAQLHKSTAEIYGISLRELEQNWRREWIGSGQIELKVELPDSP